MKCPLPNKASFAFKAFMELDGQPTPGTVLKGKVNFTRSTTNPGYITDYHDAVNWHFDYKTYDGRFRFEGNLSNSELTNPRHNPYPADTDYLPWWWWLTMAEVTHNDNLFPVFNNYAKTVGRTHSQVGGDIYIYAPYWNLDTNQDFLPAYLPFTIIGEDPGHDKLGILHTYMCITLECLPWYCRLFPWTCKTIKK